MRRLFVSIGICFTLLCLGAGAAEARPAWMQEGKAGKFMFNLKVGPAISAHGTGLSDRYATGYCGGIHRNCGFTRGTLVFDFGFAVDADNLAYIVIPLQLEVTGSDFSRW